MRFRVVRLLSFAVIISLITVISLFLRRGKSLQHSHDGPVSPFIEDENSLKSSTSGADLEQQLRKSEDKIERVEKGTEGSKGLFNIPRRPTPDEVQARLEQVISQRASYSSTTWNKSDRVIVMGHVESEDTSWVSSELADWQHAIYAIAPSDPSLYPLHTTVNKGREGMVYLSYIISHYETLPAIMVFIHPHARGWPKAWHTDAPDYSISIALEALDLSYIDTIGYANLRCRENPGCDVENKVYVSSPREGRSPEIHMAKAWRELFPTDPLPETIAAPCCAQFVVTRWQVQRRSKEEYIHFRDWLLNTTLDDADSGRVMEFLWHIIFGQAVDAGCPYIALIECRCALYGKLCPPPTGLVYSAMSKEELKWAM